MPICIATFSELLQVHNVVGADPIPEDESVGQVMIIIPINTIITIVDVAFIAAAIIIMIMCRQIQEQEATLKVLHKEQAGVKVFFFQQLLQHFFVFLYSPGPGLQA